MNSIISGEKFQSLADLSIGRASDAGDSSAFIDIAELRLNAHFDNPSIVFCFGHCIIDLSKCHNSDCMVTDCESTRTILECKYVKLWFAQNIEDITFFSLKLRFLPTGIANQGVQKDVFRDINLRKENNIHLQVLADSQLDAVPDTVPRLDVLSPVQNIHRLAEYKFSICPETDSHHLWESYLVRAVPIAINTPFMQMIHEKTQLPMVLLDSWDQLDVSKILPLYSHFDFSQGSHHLFMAAYAKQIIDA
jgi:hypothetical protein